MEERRNAVRRATLKSVLALVAVLFVGGTIEACSDLDMERIHTHGEQLLRPLKLSAAGSDDLVAFLESLTDPGAGQVPVAPVVPGCR